MNCSDHPQNPITVICVAKHECQRKLCAQCAYEHNVELQQLLPIMLFQDQLQKKFQEFKLEDKKQLDQSRLSFKSLLSETEKMLQTLWAKFYSSIKIIYDMIEQQDQKYLNLIKFDIPPSEVSYTQLELMVNILQEGILNNWNSLKCYYFSELDKANSQFKEKIDQFMKIINSQFSGIFWSETIQEYIGLAEYSDKLTKTKFQIQYTKNRDILYIQNEETIYNFKHNDLFTTPKIYTNLEIIKHFNWIGELGEKYQKVGLWTATWKGERLIGVGGWYCQDGKKQGKWKEIIENFHDYKKIFEIGDYINNKKKGKWIYISQDKEIGGGEYNQQGEKDGKWIELSDNFEQFKTQVTYHGKYQNGKKVGRWDIFKRKWGRVFGSYQKQIGGGLYDERGYENKIGNWIDISKTFGYYSQVTYCGEYRNGKKIGKWDTYDNWNTNYRLQILLSKILFYQHFRGGGSYDEEGNEVKFGNWIEFDEQNTTITYEGEYKIGKKVGKWVTWWSCNGDFNIGGGSYEDEGNGIKIGNWIEIIDEFDKQHMTQNGEYKNGKKVGRWDFFVKDFYKKPDTKIGGGLYNDEGDEIKIGNWIEIIINGYNDFQITSTGEYKHGKKAGRWDFWFNKDQNNYKMQIFVSQGSGGGLYDERGDEIKIGKWIVISNQLSKDILVTYEGEYKNGKKCGRWDILFNRKKFGGGSYDAGELGIKTGNWIDFDETSGYFNDQGIKVEKGEYKNGQKVGVWVNIFKCFFDQEKIRPLKYVKYYN
ncbi:unnamed protein product [Paramecium pentaurelia]|uniref:Uncharacterized protein n=1 Tax=Paramecium pentaurelia TaxID=43138 RepID=A0A8S1YGV2_9CILI|nr:unnamed protein product [Paramecium pentaurelia]